VGLPHDPHPARSKAVDQLIPSSQYQPGLHSRSVPLRLTTKPAIASGVQIGQRTHPERTSGTKPHSGARMSDSRPNDPGQLVPISLLGAVWQKPEKTANAGVYCMLHRKTSGASSERRGHHESSGAWRRSRSPWLRWGSWGCCDRAGAGIDGLSHRELWRQARQHPRAPVSRPATTAPPRRRPTPSRRRHPRRRSHPRRRLHRQLRPRPRHHRPRRTDYDAANHGHAPVESPPAPTLPVTGTSEMVLLATATVLIIGGAVLLGLLRMPTQGRNR
jgi:hypothetical protein